MKDGLTVAVNVTGWFTTEPEGSDETTVVAVEVVFTVWLGDKFIVLAL